MATDEGLHFWANYKQTAFDRGDEFFTLTLMTKKITIEGLARLLQREFRALRTEMATKTELAALKEDLTLLRKDTETGFLAVAQSLKAIHGELKDLKGMDAELTSLRLRVARVERKVGLSR